MPRRFQFSLRVLLVALTAACLCSAWTAERAKRQRRAVDAIEEVGGIVQYDWQTQPMLWPIVGGRRLETISNTNIPDWPGRTFGVDRFHQVKSVFFREFTYDVRRGPRGKPTGCYFPQLNCDLTKELIPHLKSLHGLEAIRFQDHPEFAGGVQIGQGLSRGQCRRITEQAEAELRAALPHCQIIHIADRLSVTTLPRD